MIKKSLLSGVFVIFYGWAFAQSPERLTRFTAGLDAGSGLAIHSCCSDMWGFYTFGGNMEYRFRRRWSVESSLRYLSMEGRLSSYRGDEYIFSGFYRVNNPSLTVGPRFNIPLHSGRELSISPKAGFLLNRVSQDIHNSGLLFQTRTYKPNLLPAFELGARFTWWLTERLAVESFLVYFANSDDNATPRLQKEEGQPFPEPIIDWFPDNFIRTLDDRPGELILLNMGLGLRFRL
jgi:hypothetical protein